MFNKLKENTGIVVCVTLVLILTVLFIDFISLPVYGQRILCGTRMCICFCIDLNGSCYCIVQANHSCECYCDNDKNDICII